MLLVDKPERKLSQNNTQGIGHNRILGIELELALSRDDQLH